jgi:hypothetical protein
MDPLLFSTVPGGSVTLISLETISGPGAGTWSDGSDVAALDELATVTVSVDVTACGGALVPHAATRASTKTPVTIPINLEVLPMGR